MDTTPPRVVTPRQAGQVLAAIREKFSAYWENCEPRSRPRVDHGGAHPVIVWEAGSPYQWPHLFVAGGLDEEMATLAEEFTGRDEAFRLATHGPAIIPDGVRAEPVDGCTLGLYPD